MNSLDVLFQASLGIENNKWTNDTLAALPTCKGVLLFADAAGRPIQLLQAANCRRTAQARLVHDDTQSAPRKKADVSDLTTCVYYTCCYNNFLSQVTYTHLAHILYENESESWIQLPKISFAVIDTSALLPYFHVTEAVEEHSGQKRFGLFASRKAASEFCEILNTIFVLCRNPSLLKTGRESSCPYLQMQTCPGPCLHAALQDDYAEAVQSAIQTAAGNVESASNQFRQQMQQASEQMAFEKAQYCKKKMELLEKLNRPDFLYVHPLKDICFLHIDIGPKEKLEGSNRKIRQLMWYKVTADGAYRLGSCTPDTTDDIKAFLETNWPKNDNPLDIRGPKELLSLVSLHLFRSQQSGIWLDCAGGIWLEKIISELQSCFELNLSTAD